MESIVKNTNIGTEQEKYKLVTNFELENPIRKAKGDTVIQKNRFKA